MARPVSKKIKKDENINHFSELMKKSDQAIIITSTRGKIEVLGVKNTNYAHEAKGLIIGALDSYNVRPIVNSINNYTNNIVSNIEKMGKDLIKFLKSEEKQNEYKTVIPEQDNTCSPLEPNSKKEKNKDVKEEE